ncbi:unnamed protein product [Gongylonema pulchrum]|uniref:Lysozyme inhibitor n=1 Tax=Gongylonema pulchrum TaxID=637853 RepID=A0A183DES5_9BILA|nr:unnamed protein product [Gongylonema pulchrum]
MLTACLLLSTAAVVTLSDNSVEDHVQEVTKTKVSYC